MDNFPPNSKTSKTPRAQKADDEKKVTKVVTGDVVQKKKSFGNRFKDVFLGGDFQSATRYIAAEVLLPAFRNMIVDATSKGVERMIYGDSPNRRSMSMPGHSRMQYNSIYSKPGRGLLPDQPRRGITRRQGYDDIILASAEEAEIVVERLCDLIDEYSMASVADLHELVGLPATFVDNQWGWTDKRSIFVRQIRDGWLLDMPAVEPLT